MAATRWATSIRSNLANQGSGMPDLAFQNDLPIHLPSGIICVRCEESEDKQFFEHSVLRDFQSTGDDDIQCQKSRKMVSVKALLGNIFSVREEVKEVNSQEKAILSLIKEGHLEDALEQMDEARYPDAGLWLAEFRSAKRMRISAGGDPAEFSKTESRLRVAAMELLEKRLK